MLYDKQIHMQVSLTDRLPGWRKRLGCDRQRVYRADEKAVPPSNAVSGRRGLWTDWSRRRIAAQVFVSTGSKRSRFNRG